MFLNKEPEEAVYQVSYVVGPAFRNTGYATEAVHAVRDHLFEAGAKALGYTWTQELKGCGNDTPGDFFSGLLAEYREEMQETLDANPVEEDVPDSELPMPWLAEYVARVCAPFSFHVEGETPDAATSVLLVDTMGELMRFYAAADVAFVGGSLVPIGGHNLLEPAALGVPVLGDGQLVQAPARPQSRSHLAPPTPATAYGNQKLIASITHAYF